MFVACNWRYAAPKIIKDGSYWQLDAATFFSTRLHLAETDGRVVEYTYDRHQELYCCDNIQTESSVIQIKENCTFERRFLASGVVETFDADGRFIGKTALPSLSPFKSPVRLLKNGNDFYLSVYGEE